jgi:LysR family transcriptional regulator (chromosome initiation inhibitor)
VECSTVHGAARLIGLTQTGVTQRIRSLERDLGVTLFLRSRRGMRLTAEGESFLRYCQRIRTIERELHSTMGGSGAGFAINVTISGPSAIMRSRVIPSVMKIAESVPELTFTFSLDDYETGLKKLKTGESQLAVLQRHEVANELDSKLLKPVRYILVVPQAWQHRPLEEIIQTERIVDFNQSDDATFSFLRKYHLSDIARKDRHFVNNTDALASVVDGGYGYTVLSEEFAEPHLRSGVLFNICPDRDYEYEVALAWYPRPELPDYFARLISVIR